MLEKYKYKLRRKFKIPHRFCLIHIGKCGGTSLKHTLRNSKKYRGIHIVHIEKPAYHRKTRYIILVRDPISRCFSAFNWRYRKVCIEETEANRFPGEFEVLDKYKSLSKLAEGLYDSEGKLNSDVAAEFEKVHHLRERIGYYLSDFLRQCPPTSIIAVLMTESLSEDISSLLNVPETEVKILKKNPSDITKELSPMARSHLVKYIESDYVSLFKLNGSGLIEDSVMKTIVERAGLQDNWKIFKGQKI